MFKIIQKDDKKKSFIFIGHYIQYDPKVEDLRKKTFSVNGLEINPKKKGFALSVGSKGYAKFWNLKEKQSIRSIEFLDCISCCTISKDGRYAAFAIGYDWSQGIWNLQNPPSIAIGTYCFSEQSFISDN
jgi:WD40 repeat protein